MPRHLRSDDALGGAASAPGDDGGQATLPIDNLPLCATIAGYAVNRRQ
jgi:hypothetical protein